MTGGPPLNKLESQPTKDHLCHIWSKLTQLFQRRRLKSKLSRDNHLTLSLGPGDLNKYEVLNDGSD